MTSDIENNSLKNQSKGQADIYFPATKIQNNL